MRKFSRLEEDRMNDSIQARDRFEYHYEEIQEKLEAIKNGIEEEKQKFEKDSHNWGRVGSLAQVNKLLSEIMEFMNFKTEREKEAEKYNI